MAVASRPAPAPSACTTVEFQDDQNQWQPFTDAAEVQRLLDALRLWTAGSGAPSVVQYDARNFTYSVDLARRTQTNTHTLKVRCIRFV